jgi:polyisoprenoid-binding protein YceI
MKWILPALLALTLVPGVCQAAAPVFVITPAGSSVTFKVKASVPIAGRFDKWHSTLVFASPDIATGVLEIMVDANSVDTGSGLKNGALKGAGFFDVQKFPTMSFRSTKVTQTGPETFAVGGVFTLRGISRPETLVLTTSGRGTSSGQIKGTMRFDRKAYGMTGGVPLVKIADEVDVSVDLKVKRVSGPPVAVN